MRCRLLFAEMIVFLVLFSFAAGVSGVEKLDRGLVAVEREDGSVFLNWRLLERDIENIAFGIRRFRIGHGNTAAYKLEAYRLDGAMMWRYGMGWSIEAGIWYSPWIVYDVDADGKAMQPIEGRAIAVVDCLGDHREEVITSLKGELRIYTTIISTSG